MTNGTGRGFNFKSMGKRNDLVNAIIESVDISFCSASKSKEERVSEGLLKLSPHLRHQEVLISLIPKLDS